MTHPTSALDDTVHQRVRLGILAVLSALTKKSPNRVVQAPEPSFGPRGTSVGGGPAGEVPQPAADSREREHGAGSTECHYSAFSTRTRDPLHVGVVWLTPSVIAPR